MSHPRRKPLPLCSRVLRRLGAHGGPVGGTHTVSPLRMLGHLCCLLCVSLLAACAGSSNSGVSANVDLASEPTVYVDTFVRQSPVQVYVHPDGPPVEPPKALFMPLRLTQQMENAVSTGYNLSRLYWQSWLQAKVFPVLEFAATNTPYRPDVALAMGRQRGADLVVGGYITHFIDGGTTGDTSVSVAIEIYEVKTGNLLWSMAQGGFMQKVAANDYLIFAVKSRMPTDPAYAVLMTLGRDMGKTVRNWIEPEYPKQPWYKMEPGAFR